MNTKGEFDYRYENIAVNLPLVAAVKTPKEGDKARTQTGVVLIYRDDRWQYW